MIISVSRWKQRNLKFNKTDYILKPQPNLKIGDHFIKHGGKLQMWFSVTKLRHEY